MGLASIGRCLTSFSMAPLIGILQNKSTSIFYIIVYLICSFLLIKSAFRWISRVTIIFAELLKESSNGSVRSSFWLCGGISILCMIVWIVEACFNQHKLERRRKEESEMSFWNETIPISRQNVTFNEPNKSWKVFPKAIFSTFLSFSIIWIDKWLLFYQQNLFRVTIEDNICDS